MSFTPLPRSFLTDLERTDPAVVELGVGDGRFSRLLGERGVRTIGLDRLRGPSVDLVGDARHPPLRDGGVELLVAANLLRHLLPGYDGGRLLSAWIRLLRPGGRLWILEDAPEAHTPAEGVYRDLHDFLGRLSPAGRGPLLSLDRFRATATASGSTRGWTFGSARNAYALDAPEELLRRLDDLAADAGDEAARLAARIREDGLAYGDYWWARYERTAS